MDGAKQTPIRKSKCSRKKIDSSNKVIRTRGRKQQDYDTYKEKTLISIATLQERLETVTRRSDIKRLKNQISAYQSRLVQRAQLEDINAQLEVRKA